MRQSVAKSLTAKARYIGESFKYPFLKRLSRTVKKAYNRMPAPERKHFSVKEVLVTNK